ncbi:MAG TPA: chemotaxis response regulator protein-glutamate methylesterase [Candidatus Acidoferrum sp.]|nr:chemotaxis response regulator protein-glutamate methylesterase [Candidatus Acidoferrum sp.]
MSERIRVLVVDDSALMRKLIPTILSRDPDIEVVGTAMDGAFALKKIEELHPDVVTLDLEMPRMDGMETLRLIMRRGPIPVILFSTHSKEGAYSTFKALALGAIDFVAKPKEAAAGHLDSIAGHLIEKIKVAKRASGRRLLSPLVEEVPPARKKGNRPAVPPNRIIAIGVSTGGPNALQYVFSQIPADFPASFVVVQHMPEGFTEMFARRLDECCAIDVQEAKSGDLLVAGRVLICPGNRHLMVRRMPRGDMAVLSDSPPVNGHRPSVDVLFHSVAQDFGPMAVGVLMTGMGEDGAEGLGAIRTAGGMTIAQSEDTCVVGGMPRAAILKGYASKILPLENLGIFLANQFGGDRSPEKSDKSEKSDRHDEKDKSGRSLAAEKKEKEKEKAPVSSPRS